MRSLDDELDWKLLEQLHKVVLQLSDTCFKIKQICVTAQIAVATLLVKFTSNQLDDSIFVAALFTALLFWLLDGVTYYYQVKIRVSMNGITARIKERQQSKSSILNADGTPLAEVIDSERGSGNRLKRVFNSYVNHSMWLYYILIFTLPLWIAYNCNSIKT